MGNLTVPLTFAFLQHTIVLIDTWLRKDFATSEVQSQVQVQHKSPDSKSNEWLTLVCALQLKVTARLTDYLCTHTLNGPKAIMN